VISAIYTRVSTSTKTAEGDYRQDARMQVVALEKLAADRGWPVVYYSDRGSGANPDRAHFKRLMEDARRGKFQAVLVWKFDRFARSLKDLVNALEELNALGVRLISYTEAIDTSTPAGKAVFQMAGVFAEFERSLTLERVNAGIEHAREHGTKSGKAIGRPLKVVRRDEIRRMKDAGVPVREICSKFGIGMSALYKACSETRPVESGHQTRPAGG